MAGAGFGAGPLSAALVPFVGLGCGIVAIVYSSQVQAKFQAGDFHGAQSAANNARIWAIVGIVINVLGLLSLITQNATY